jgi:hypothetical protein
MHHLTEDRAPGEGRKNLKLSLADAVCESADGSWKEKGILERCIGAV